MNIILLTLLGTFTAHAMIEESVPPQPLGIRFVDFGKDATTTFVSYKKDDVRIILIPTIHVAESSFYERIDEEISGKTVLYEMDAPISVSRDMANKLAKAPAKIQKGARALYFLTSPVKQTAAIFGLKHQSDVLTYKNAKKLVHADVAREWAYDELSITDDEIMRNLFFRVRKYAGLGDCGLEEGLIASLSQLHRTIGSIESAFSTESSPDELERTELFRDPLLLKTLAKQIDDGEQNIALVYGSNHLPLVHQFLRGSGFDIVKSEAVTAIHDFHSYKKIPLKDLIDAYKFD